MWFYNGENIMTPIKAFSALLFGFEGRINRLRYLISLPIIIIGQIALTILWIVIADIRLLHAKNHSSINWELLQGSDIFFLCLIVIAIVVFLIFKYSHISRRIHDFDKHIPDSRAGKVVMTFDITFIMVMFFPRLVGMLYLEILLELIILISLAFFKGSDGDNEFGPKPKPFGKTFKINDKEEES
ncbi:DUF805 domain-containing protein [Avibacterium paragallinarum]|uniref:DUF805 domain-containing protein n=1 Tax=Avibacterium paragallinarum TaxID=728 RepID=A0ABU7QSS4_AVIPA|nr:DUF805 domain-containing protein [Avibacterium paragallinarum]